MEKKGSTGFVFWQRGRRIEIGGGPNPQIVSALENFRQTVLPGLRVSQLAKQTGLKEAVVQRGLKDLQRRGLGVAEYGDGKDEYDGHILVALDRGRG